MQEYSQDYDAAEQNKLALAAKRMQMQQAQSGMEDQQRIRGLASQYGGDENALVKALRGGGYFEQAGGIEKQIAERLKGQQDRDKTAVEVDEKRFKVAKERRDAYEAARSGFERDPALSKDKVLKVLEEMGTYGMLPGELVQKLTANLPDDPEQLRNDIRNGNLSRLTPEQMVTLFAPKYEYQDSGQQRIPVQMNMNAPGAVAPQTIQRVQTPDNVATQASAAEQRAQQQRQYEETKRFEREKFGYQQKKDAEKPAPGAASAKPMPAAAMRMQDDDLNAIGTFAGIDKDLEGIQKQLETGKLNLGLVGNITGDVRNRVGMSNENSRNLATFKAKLENMRNSVLLLNKGVQTEGDAQRAMNEMIANINDPDVVKQRLKEIRALNQRAVQLKKNNLDMLRRNYGQEDMDYSKYENQPPATNLPNGNALSPEDTQALEWGNKNPNDPRSKAIKQRIGGG
jgi:hypothetical protein